VGFFDFLKKTVDQAKMAEDKRKYSDDPWKKYSVEKRIDDSAYQPNYDYYAASQCPACQGKLKDVNQKDCPHCGEAVVGEKHFQSKKRMLLTGEQAERLHVEKQHYKDLKWALELADQLGTNDREMVSMVKATKPEQKFVVLWVRANDMSMAHATKSRWLSYRNTRLAMGDILRREGKKEKALGFYLGVSFIDANGPADDGPFQPQGALPKRPVLQNVVALAKELELDEQALQAAYLEAAGAEKNRFMPLEPAQTWDGFLREFRKVRGV
jgi:hypothetical protein